MPEMASGKWKWLQQTVTWQLSGPCLGAISGWQCRTEWESLQGVPAEIEHSPWGLSAADISADDIVYAHVGGQGMSCGRSWSQIYSGRGSRKDQSQANVRYTDSEQSSPASCPVPGGGSWRKPSTKTYWMHDDNPNCTAVGEDRVAAQKHTPALLHWLPQDHYYLPRDYFPFQKGNFFLCLPPHPPPPLPPVLFIFFNSLLFFVSFLTFSLRQLVFIIHSSQKLFKKVLLQLFIHLAWKLSEDQFLPITDAFEKVLLLASMFLQIIYKKIYWVHLF